MMHVDPMHIHIDIPLGLDHIQINEVLLLGPEQLIPSKVGTRIDVGIDLPTRDELSKRHLIHTHGGFLLFGGGGLGPALGGTGALRSFILIAQTLGARVTAWIGTVCRST